MVCTSRYLDARIVVGIIVTTARDLIQAIDARTVILRSGNGMQLCRAELLTRWALRFTRKSITLSLFTENYLVRSTQFVAFWLLRSFDRIKLRCVLLEIVK